MKKLIASLVFVTSIIGSVISQDCSIYFPAEKGAVREMTYYDQKDKVTSKVVQEITEVNKNASGIEIGVKSSIYDQEDAMISEITITVGCKDGVFKIDMEDYVGEFVRAYQSMEVEFTGDDLAFPAKMKPGDVLDNGEINIKVYNSGMTLMNMDVIMSNRKVEAIDNITTPAGTFECYRISYNTVAKTKILNIQTSSVEWIAENVGLVKTESFNKKGKSTGYSLLTDLK